MGTPGEFAPVMQKRALKYKKEPLKITIDCNVKAFNVADLVNGMWKVAPKNKYLIFGLILIIIIIIINNLVIYDYDDDHHHDDGEPKWIQIKILKFYQI